jgi:hypothetical protein
VVNSAIIASSALRPSQGSDDACDSKPSNTTSTSSLASRMTRVCVRSEGWNRRAASMPSNAPSSIMIALPEPASSAGVPRNTMVPRISEAIRARARAAPTPLAAMALCPQP